MRAREAVVLAGRASVTRTRRRDGGGDGRISSADTGTGGRPSLLAAGGYAGAMLMAGLLTAFHRLSGRHRHGLVEEGRWRRCVRGYLSHHGGSRSPSAASTWSRRCSACWVRSIARRGLAGGGRAGASTSCTRCMVVLAWTLGALLAKLIASGAVTGYMRAVGTVIWPLDRLLRPWASLLLVIMDRLDDTLWAAEAQPLLSSGEIRSLIERRGRTRSISTSTSAR